MSWTTTYRPHRISDLTLTAVKETLLKWLDQGWIPQTLLFTGPKGTGKTTAARLIAAVVNDVRNTAAVESAYRSKTKKKTKLLEPDPADSTTQSILQGESYAVLEIDAASHRGIDDVRDLRQQIQLAPALGPMMVCILDEAHMLTKEAWNALLKTLEEPPAHVIFVLATTELHKVPATIQSRCQIVRFSQPTTAELSQTLQRVADQEGVKVSSSTAKAIAQQAQGSVRDAIKLLERVIVEDGADSLLAIDHSLQAAIEQTIRHILARDSAGITDVFAQLRASGADERVFHTGLVAFLHQILVNQLLGQATEKNEISAPAAEFLLKEFCDSQLSASSLIPFLKLELQALSIISRAQKQGSPTQISPKQTSSIQLKSAGSSKKSSPESIVEAKETDSSLKESQDSKVDNSNLDNFPMHSDSGNFEQPVLADHLDTVLPSKSMTNHSTSAQVVQATISGAAAELLARWGEFTAAVTQVNLSLAALLQSANPELLSDTCVKLKLAHQFHAERVQQPKVRQLIEQIALDLCRSSVSFETEVVKPTRDSAVGKPSLLALASDSLL